MKNEILKKSFKPIINNDSNILILGSLPSDKSIVSNEYYGNKTNQFWDILSLIFENKKIEFQNYNEKMHFLDNNHIALWDVYCLAERKGSLDDYIKNGKYNNLKKLIEQYSNIKSILVNGKKAEKEFIKYMKLKHVNYSYKYVPSSSSANTRYSLLEKVEYWKKAILQ